MARCSGDVDEGASYLSHAAASRPLSKGVLVFFAALGGFLFGYDTGVISGAIPYVQDDLLRGVPPVRQTALLGLIVSAAIWGAAIGAASGGRAADTLGRWKTLWCADALFIAGSLAMAFAPSVPLLVTGRLVVGLGIGVASVTVPIYLAECSPADVRAQLVTANVLMITAGQAVSYLVNYALSGLPGQWRWMLGVAAAPAVLQLLGLQLLPETPRWLLEKGHTQRAHRALQRLFPDSQIAAVFESIQHELWQADTSQGSAGSAEGPTTVSFITALRDPVTRAAMRVGVTLQALQQLAGINTVMYFTPVLLQMAGFHDKRQALLLACLPASVNAIGTIVGMRLIERAGRRVLLLGSLAGIVITLAALSLVFFLSDAASSPVSEPAPSNATACPGAPPTCSSCLHAGCGYCQDLGLRTGDATYPDVGGGSCLVIDEGDSAAQACAALAPQHAFFVDGCPSSYSTLLLAVIMAYLLAFSTGMGPVPWAINAEIYALHVRGLANGLAGTANWLTNAVVSQTFLTLTHAAGAGGTFALYALVSVAGALWAWFAVPETKGLSLAEVQALFARRAGCDVTTPDAPSRQIAYVAGHDTSASGLEAANSPRNSAAHGQDSTSGGDEQVLLPRRISPRDGEAERGASLR